MKRQVTEALRLQFRPEFLNRIDEVIVFHGLTDADLAAIVDLLVADLQRRLASQDLTLELTPAARALIAREGTDPTFGARPLKRTIQRLVENPLARALIEGRFRTGQTITADADPVGTTLVFSADGEAVVADAASRRDARRREGTEAPVGGGSHGGGRRRSGASILELPDIEGEARDRGGREDDGDGGGRPN